MENKNSRWLGRIFSLVLAFFFVLFPLTEGFAADLPVTSPFGWRVHPITGVWTFHAGVDLGYDYGTPVPALFSGVVEMAGNYSDGYGNQVLLYHPDSDCYTRYGHMSTVYVTQGQEVNAGDTIGLVGSTGVSTGPHLHVEYIVPDGNGEYSYTDPLVLWQ